jgi:hypothetical protein
VGGGVGAIAALRIGRAARRLLEGPAAIELAAVHARSLHIASAGRFACIGPASIGDGPLSIIVAAADVVPLQAGLAGGDGRLSASAGCLARGGSLQLDTSVAALWQPAAWPTPPTHDSLRQAAEELRRQLAALERAGPAVSTAAPVAAATSRRLADGLAALSAFVAGRDEAERACRLLLGLGPGLTPAGDDALVGALIALDAVGAEDLRQALAVVALALAPALTSPLSAAYVGAAAELGEAHASLHDVIAASLAGPPSGIAREVKRAAAVGHSSGRDAMAGALAALEGRLAALCQGRGPASAGQALPLAAAGAPAKP